METSDKGQVSIFTENGGFEIPQKMLSILGSDLKCTLANDVFLVISNLSDDRFPGVPIALDGMICYIPDSHSQALHLQKGDYVHIVFSEPMQFAIIHKIDWMK